MLHVQQKIIYVKKKPQRFFFYDCEREKNIGVIRNGTDLKPQKIYKKSIQEIKEKYSLTDKFIFLFVGRIVENKNIQFSLRVLKNIKEKGIDNFAFVIVGSGDYVDNLKELAKEYNLQDNIVFTGKIMDRNILSQVYACADLFMFPSEFDTCGIVALEAAVNSLPSVMIENSCASELVVSGENGLALPEKEDVWADEIIKIMKDDKKLSKIKKNAKDTLYIPWEKIVLEYIDFYKKMISKND